MKQLIPKHFFPPLAILLSLAAGLGLGAYGSLLDRQRNQAFISASEDFFLDEISGNTLNLHYTIADPAAFGVPETAPSLGSVNLETSEARYEALRLRLKQFKELSSPRLTDANQLALDSLCLALSTELTLEGLELLEEPLSPSLGIQAQLPVLLAEYSFRTKEDIEDYLALTSSADDYFRQLLAFEREKAASGLFMSDASAARIIEQCQAFISDPESNYLEGIFSEKLAEFPGLTARERENYLKRHRKALEERLIPGYRLLIDGLKSLMGSGTNENGLCYLPGGRDYYRYLLRSGAGLYQEPDQIRDRLIAQAAADFSELRSLLQKNPRLGLLSQEAEVSAQSPAEMLQELREKIKEDFPASEAASYEIKYVHPDLEQYLSPAFYLTPPIDTLSPNAIYINRSSGMNGVSLYTTLAHEGFPGHLYQTLYFSASEPPLIRHLLENSGYIEGWATYIEPYAYVYSGLEPEAAHALWLNRSLNLCLCSLLDMGIHYYGWTPKETSAFLARFGITDAAATAELFQYIVETPGNYLKYCMGYISLLDLQEEMKEKLGSGFDLKEFHQAVLTAGPCQFPVLEKYVEEALA